MKKLAFGFYVALVVVLMCWGYYQAIYVAPLDAMQGEIFRIIYYHVPSASVAFVFFAVSLVGSIGFLASRGNHADRAQMFDAWARGDGAEACMLSALLVKLTRALFAESNPVPVKYALELMGHMAAEVRLPLCAAAPATRVQVADAVRRLGMNGARQHYRLAS